MQAQSAAGTQIYSTDLTYEMLELLFYPEEDFYLDADGNPVFFIQSAYVCDSADGLLLFPFTIEELLDEL